jgi:hypothetical protein
MSAPVQPVVHTPGPWECDGDEVMADEYGKHVATAWNNDKVAPAESEANAKLISLAPDMLQLITDFAEWDRKYPKACIHPMSAERALDSLFERAKQIVNEVV